MIFSPIVPASGFLGYQFLERTREAQTERMVAVDNIDRDMAYFRDKIGSVDTAEELVEDFQLRRVALGAFGLQDDLPNRAFIQKVLEEGTTDPGAFANRLTDPRYRAMASAFGFDAPGGPLSQLPGFADRIESGFKERSFEVAVGQVDSSLRLAISLERELGELADRGLSGDGAWFTILGSPPLRQAFELALGLPSSIGTVDLDRQLSFFRDAAQRRFGVSEVADFAEPAVLEEFRRNFLVRADLQSGPSLAQAPVLSLFQSRPAGVAGIFSILASR